MGKKITDYDLWGKKVPEKSKERHSLFSKNFNAVHLAAAMALSAAVSAYVGNVFKGEKSHEPGISSKPVATHVKQASAGSISASATAAVLVKAPTQPAQSADKPAEPEKSVAQAHVVPKAKTQEELRSEREQVQLGERVIEEQLKLIQAKIHRAVMRSENPWVPLAESEQDIAELRMELEKQKGFLRDQKELLAWYKKDVLAAVASEKSNISGKKKPRSVQSRTFISQAAINTLVESVKESVPSGGSLYSERVLAGDGTLQTRIYFQFDDFRPKYFTAELPENASRLTKKGVEDWIAHLYIQFLDEESAKQQSAQSESQLAKSN